MKKASFIARVVALSAAMLLCLGTVAWAEGEADKTESHGGATHEGGAKGEHAEHEEHEGPPGEINWADFGNKKQLPFAALFINFAALIAIYWYFGRKPIATALVERKESIAKDIESAQGMLAEAKERAKRYQSKLEDIDADAAQAKATLVTAGEGEKSSIEKAAAEKVERMKRDADFMVEQEGKQLQKDLLRETVEAAIADAESLIAKGISQTDQERLAEEFLASLAQTPASSTGRSA